MGGKDDGVVLKEQFGNLVAGGEQPGGYTGGAGEERQVGDEEHITVFGIFFQRILEEFQ